MTLATIQQMNYQQLSETFSIGRNAADALANYLLWLKWYSGDIEGATEAASDFIETADDIDELEGALLIIKEYTQ